MSGRQFLILVLVVAIAAFAGGAFSVRWLQSSSPQKSLAARELHLVDESGTERASFQINLADAPSLILRDKQGHRRAMLSFTENGEPIWSE
ncbi:MAG TPA: hypothetical protein VGL38_00590 [bacterium]|jgi:hypothetical protein